MPVSYQLSTRSGGGHSIGNAMMSDFTPRGQQVLALARQEAERFNHHYVGTEHLLLGLIKLGQGVAVNVLQRMGLDLEGFAWRWKSMSARIRRQKWLAAFRTRPESRRYWY